MILIYEPENPEALQFLPMIEEKMQVKKLLLNTVLKFCVQNRFNRVN